jgi:hypothetical protein
MLHYELYAHRGTTGDMMTYVIWWLSSFNFFEIRGTDSDFYWVLWETQVHLSALLIAVFSFWWPAIDLLNVTSWEFYLSYGYFKAQGLLVMTLIEELNAIYDYCKGFWLKMETVEYDLNPIYLLYYK